MRGGEKLKKKKRTDKTLRQVLVRGDQEISQAVRREGAAESYRQRDGGAVTMGKVTFARRPEGQEGAHGDRMIMKG